MVRTLRKAAVAGPEMEEEIWKVFCELGGLDDELLKAIQNCYYQKMRSVVSGEQVAALRR